VGSPLISHPDVLIAMNEISLRKFAPQVESGALIIYSRERLPEGFEVPAGARAVCVPAFDMADQLGSSKVANVILLGALLAETECLPESTAEAVLAAKVKNPKYQELNRQALALGRRYDEHELHVSVSQPDGFAD